MGGKQSKCSPPECTIKSFKKGYSGDYRVKLTPGKLQTFCETDWPSFRVGWPTEGSLDTELVSKVFRVVKGGPGHPDQFLYVDCRQDIILSQPCWLKACLEENCKITMAWVMASSEC